jgi:hypothetical protein
MGETYPGWGPFWLNATRGEALGRSCPNHATNLVIAR